MQKLRNLPIWIGLVMAVLLGAMAVSPVLADGTVTIGVDARGASVGQRVEVQWGDAIGGWHRVDGWSGSLDQITPQGVPFKRYTVFPSNYGQGPFRWVIYNLDGQTVWAIGPKFTLPTVDGTSLIQPLDQQGPVTPTPAPTGSTSPVGPTGPVAPASTEPLMRAHGFTYGLGSGDSSKITVLIGGLPSTTWITVQWWDSAGIWRTVDGWQGTASSVDPNGVLSQQWSVPPSLFGLGPFRWALYDFQGGNLIGVSPSFNMPKTARLNFYMSMAPA